VARRKLTDTSHPDSSLTAGFWLTFSDESQPPMRDKIIFLTFKEVAKVGPGLFNVSSVCDRLGITLPMINHYFGSRDELLAETASVFYARYIAQLWEAVECAPRDPRSRIEAWMRRQIKGTDELGGWGGIYNYPVAMADVSQIVERKYGDMMRERFEFNLMGLGLLIRDMRAGEVSGEAVDASPELRHDLLADDELLMAVSAVSWATLGVSVWNSGRHLPSSGIADVDARREALIDAYVNRILDTI